MASTRSTLGLIQDRAAAEGNEAPSKSNAGGVGVGNIEAWLPSAATILGTGSDKSFTFILRQIDNWKSKQAES